LRKEEKYSKFPKELSLDEMKFKQKAPQGQEHQRIISTKLKKHIFNALCKCSHPAKGQGNHNVDNCLMSQGSSCWHQAY